MTGPGEMGLSGQSPARPGEDEAQIVVHRCIDLEQHARSFNEGYEAAMTQCLAGDPTMADLWLAEHDGQMQETVLAEAEKRIEANRAQAVRGTPGYAVGNSTYNEGLDTARLVVAALHAEVTR